jgi:hypothetical protein
MSSSSAKDHGDGDARDERNHVSLMRSCVGDGEHLRSATDQNGVAIPGPQSPCNRGQNLSATTDAQGNYCSRNLVANASYTVSASLSGVTFYPASFALANLPADRTVNFTKAVTRYTITDLGALTAGPQSNGWDVNNSGQATGWSSSLTSTNFQPYFYNNGTVTNMTPFGTGTNALAIAINESGRVVGYSELTPGGALHGFFSDSGGVLKDIGTGWRDQSGVGANDNGSSWARRNFLINRGHLCGAI